MFQCDSFQLNAFQNDWEPARRRRRVTVLLPRRQIHVIPEEEWEPDDKEWERESDMLARALREDEEFLLFD